MIRRLWRRVRALWDRLPEDGCPCGAPAAECPGNAPACDPWRWL